jgi:predicted Zn-dependent peptidase
MGVYAGCAAADAAPLARVCAREVLALTAGPGDAELARAKAQLKAHLFMGREQPLNRAETAAGQTLLFGHLYAPVDMARAIDAVSASDITRVGRRLLSPGLTAGAVLGSRGALGAVEAYRDALLAG